MNDGSGPGARLGELKIERSSTSEQVAGALREAILHAELTPGTPLREAALASSMGISRNTVREAIQVLVREGLVTHQMHRGAEVTRLTEDDVVDLFNVRRVIELRAIEATAGRGTGVNGLLEHVDALAAAVDSHDFERITDSDIAFHRALVRFLESPRIDRFFEAIQAELRLCVGIVDRSDEDPTRLIAEHRELCELIAAGRQLECQERLRKHLDDGERLVRAIARRQGEQAPIRPARA